jgi:hypothetical protein
MRGEFPAGRSNAMRVARRLPNFLLAHSSFVRPAVADRAPVRNRGSVTIHIAAALVRPCALALFLGSVLSGACAVAAAPPNDPIDDVTIAPYQVPKRSRAFMFAPATPCSLALASQLAQGHGCGPPDSSPSIAASGPNQFIVAFADTQFIPRFPEPADTLARDTPVNVATLGIADRLIDSIRASRAADYRMDLGRIAERCPGMKVLERYWITQAALIELPSGRTPSECFADTALARYVFEPRFHSFVIAGSGTTTSTLRAGCEAIGSEPYRARGLGRGWLALLDSGVRRSHRLLDRPGQIAAVYDCARGDSNCAGGIPGDPSLYGHGTPSSGILAGNDAMGADLRGVTDASLDVFQTSDQALVTDGAALIRGIERAIARLDRVLTIEADVSDGTRAYDAVSRAADRAFDAGAVVITTVGDNGGCAFGSPARGTRTLAVGGAEIGTQGTWAPLGQNHGRTPDGRGKPELLAPTGCVTAAGMSDSDTGDFTLSSGAAPFAGGAALLVRNWLARTGHFDPGQAYVQLLLAGSQVP